MKLATNRLRLLQMQLFHDVFAHPLGRRRRQSQKRYPRQSAPQLSQLAVGGTKIMPPHRDAVRLVHRYETNLQFGEKLLKPRQSKSLRRDIEDLQGSLLCLLLHAVDLEVWHPAVDIGRGDSGGLEGHPPGLS